MKLNLNEEHLLATLVSETYQCVDEAKENSINLSAYFESKSKNNVTTLSSDHFLEDKLLRSNVSFSCMNYSHETSSFHFELKGVRYTAPRNWGEFNCVFESHSTNEYKIVENFNDDLLMTDIFNSEIDYDFQTLCFFGHGESYLIFLPKKNKEILNWLNKYCESREQAA